MNRLSISAGALFAGFTLACAAPTGDQIAVPADTPFLVQDASGLWTPDGTRIAEIGGSGMKDLLIIDTSRETVFLLSSDKSVRVAHRTSGGYRVETVLEGASVLRPMKGAALVELADGSKSLVGLDGKPLVDGVYASPRGSEEPPVDQPEYWWRTDYFDMPLPACTRAGPCGYLGPEGSWLGEQGDHPVSAMSVEPMFRGYGLLSADGTRYELKDKAQMAMGPASEGMVLVGTPSEGAPGTRLSTSIVDLDGETLATVEAPVAWQGVCHAERGDETCRYRFHEGRAPVEIRAEEGAAQAYLSAEGSIVIGPDVCGASAPSGPFHEGRAFHCVGSQYFMVDAEGERIAGPYPAWDADRAKRNSYPFGLFFSDGLAAVPVEGGWAYVDTAGTVVLAGPYSVARPFRLGLAAVVQGDGVQYIGKDGQARLVSP